MRLTPRTRNGTGLPFPSDALIHMAEEIYDPMNNYKIKKITTLVIQSDLMLKFSLSTHTSLNKPNACLLSYIPPPIPSVPFFL